MGVATALLGWEALGPAGASSLVLPDDGQVARISSIWIANVGNATRNPILSITPSGAIGVRRLIKQAVAVDQTIILTAVVCLGPGQELSGSVAGGSTGDILVWVFGSWLLGEQNRSFP